MNTQHTFSDSAAWIAPAGGTLGAVAYATQGASGNWETELLFALHCVLGAVLGLLVRYSTRWVEGRLKRGSHREGAPAPGLPSLPGGNSGFWPADSGFNPASGCL